MYECTRARAQRHIHMHALDLGPRKLLRLAENGQSNNHAKIEAKSGNRDEKTPGILNS